MFTDQPVTPLRLEILVDVVDSLGPTGTLRREALLELLQPENLTDFNRKAAEPRVAGKETLGAAVDLGLVIEEGGICRAAERERGGKKKSTRELVLNALDNRVLTAVDVEPYFALFYSFLLGLGKEALEVRPYQEWATSYNSAVHGGVPNSNPLNATKVRGLGRWYPYAGLGWTDSGDVFNCEPYRRLQRVLPRLFSNVDHLETDLFMSKLAQLCPELDGGRLFFLANPTSAPRSKVFTLGLAQALIGLHEDGVLALHCPRDGRGWDLSAAVPQDDGGTLRSDRLDAIEWKRPKEKRAASRGTRQ